MRSVFMEKAASAVFAGAPENSVSYYMELMGTRVTWDGAVVPDTVKVTVIIFSSFVFLILSAFVMKHRKADRI